MKKMHKNKKGFTLVELSIVIAVIAILIAVLVPTFISLINSAQESNDSQLAKNMNTLLYTEEINGNTPETMEDVNNILVDNGYTIAKLTPSADGNIFVWNKSTNKISYIDGDTYEVIYSGDTDYDAGDILTASGKYWVTVESADEITTWAGLSYYLGANIDLGSSTLTLSAASSIDTGTYTLTGTVTYSGSVSSADTGKAALASASIKKAAATTVDYTTTAELRGTIDGSVTINTSNLKVINYATITNVEVGSSVSAYNEKGNITGTLTVNASNVTIENDGYVETITSTSTTTVTNNGYVANSSGSVTVSNTWTTYVYEISTYNELANFRNKVNNGNHFTGITVKLTANISLSGKTWVPIGYDSRSNYSATNTNYIYFGGTFDGQNYTISGLTNTGFTPTVTRTDTYGTGSGNKNNYLYGLFGIVHGATIENVKLTNVNIVKEDIELDSVGALVGFIDGGAYIKNCTASGSIEATDAVGGLVGRAYNTQTTPVYFDVDGNTTSGNTALTKSTGYSIVIIGCSVNMTINCSGEKAAGILGYTYTQLNYYISNCTASGSIKMTSSSTTYCAGIVVTTNGGPEIKNARARVIANCTSSMTLTASSNSAYIRNIVFGNNGTTGYCITYIDDDTYTDTTLITSTATIGTSSGIGTFVGLSEESDCAVTESGSGDSLTYTVDSDTTISWNTYSA